MLIANKLITKISILLVILGLTFLPSYVVASGQHSISKRAIPLKSRFRSIDSRRKHHVDYDQSPEAGLNPIILIPGDGGSQLQAKLDRNEVQHYYCEKKSGDWFDLWLNLSLLVPFALDCWMDNMRLVYNSTSRLTNSPPGVTTRVFGFGKTESVEFVDPAKVRGTGYFDVLVENLVSLGYERDVNIFGAPYDFRRAPNELQDYFKDLEKLIEDAYTKNRNEKVILICHSMGCFNSLYFLQSKNTAWKDKYIRSMISLAGAWGGSVKALKAFTSGDNFGVIMVPSLSLRQDFRTFPSLTYLLPTKDIWPENKVLLEHKDKNYTVNDYEQFFNDINYPIGYQMWLDTRNLSSPITAPEVEVHCLYGTGVNTIDQLKYSSTFPDGKPDIEYGDGDGTVNLLSLQGCTNWKDKQSKPVHSQSFKLVDHMTVMSNIDVLDYIGQAIAN